MSDASRMETMESRKLQEHERRKALEREKRKNKIAAHRKVCSRTISKSYINNLKSSAIGFLGDVGYFTDNFNVNVLEQNVLPWLLGHVEGFVDELDTLGQFSDVFVGSNLDECMTNHENTVRTEFLRKESVKNAIENARL